VLNKPQSKEDAISMLTQLSGNTHEVYTGVCIYYQNEFHTFSSLSKVEFADLDAEEVEYYVEQYKPYDKAGSYGAQEWIGYVAIKHIDGSFFNVMGLPIRMVYNDLKNILSK
jgi:septum formation protein